MTYDPDKKVIFDSALSQIQQGLRLLRESDKQDQDVEAALAAIYEARTALDEEQLEQVGNALSRFAEAMNRLAERERGP